MRIPPRRLLACAALLAAAALVSCRALSPSRAVASARSDLAPSNDVFDLNEEGLRVLWRQELGQSTSAPMVGIHSAGQFVVVDAGGGEVHVYSAETGQWLTGEVLPGPLGEPPVAWGDGLLLVAKNRIFGLDLSSGELSKGYDPQFALFAEPVLLRQDLLLAGGDGTLARVSTDGRTVWSFSLTAPIMEGPVQHDGNLYAAAYRDSVVALQAENGSELWRWRPPHPARVSSGVAVTGNTLYVGDNLGQLYSLGTDFGRLRWRKPLEAPIVSRPVVVGDRVLVFTNKPSVACFEAGGGADVLWKQDGATGVIAAGEELVYLLTGDNRVAAVSLATGEEIWSDPLPADCKVAGDGGRPAFYVANSAGSIVAFAELD